MTPVYQTIFGERGNCLSAAIASILELPLNEVPHFVATDKWFESLWDFCKSRGLEPTYVYPHHQLGQPPKVIPAGWHVMSGWAARGFSHACVGFQGNFVHDPHPSGRGLIQVASWLVLHPNDQMQDQFTIPYEAK